jgi:hypothetical protein
MRLHSVQHIRDVTVARHARYQRGDITTLLGICSMNHTTPEKSRRNSHGAMVGTCCSTTPPQYALAHDLVENLHYAGYDEP